MLELAGKRALITGASRGIGAGIAKALADKGADVAITYERSSESASGLVQSITAQGRRAVAIQADSLDPAAIKRAVSEAADTLGGLDILVNNAGIARMGEVVDTSDADLNAMLDVNVRAAVLTSKAVIPHLGRGGRIISIGSNLAEHVPFSGVTVYSLTKSALLAFTRGLSRELGSRDITVNLVQPGPINTDMNPADGENAEMNRSRTALGRYGAPADIGAVVAFLSSSAAGFMTGSVVTVDGGYNA